VSEADVLSMEGPDSFDRYTLVSWALPLSTSYMSLEEAILAVPLAECPIPTAYQLPLASLCMSITVSLQPYLPSGDDFQESVWICLWLACGV